MTASAPSKTAQATSETSARVGRGALIIDSSIWVATMTGRAFSRVSSMARFWTIGTCSRGSSTPRSPRATMMPSKASTISSRRSTACGFSILARRGTRAALLVHDAAYRLGVVRAAHEGQGDQVDAQVEREAEVLFVLFGEGRDADGDAREVEALVVGDHAADEDAGADAGTLDRGDVQDDASVVDEDGVAGADVSGQPAVRRGDLGTVAGHVLGGDGELVAESQAYGPVGEPAQPDLGALQVGQDADGVSGRARGLTQKSVDLLVLLMGAMAHVEPGDVDARLHQRADALWAGAGGTYGANDLCSTTHANNFR